MAESDLPGSLRGADGARRRERSQRISEIDRALAELYLHACEFVERPVSAISMSMLGHAMRELLNGLAEGLAAVEGVELPDRQDESGQIRALVDAWETSDLPTDEAPEPVTTAADPVQPIPTAVYHAAQSVVRGQKVVTSNSRTKLARIVGPRADAAAPTSRQLKKTYDFFMRWCHVERGSPHPLPAEDDVRSALAQVESILDVRLASFFAVKSELDEILRSTNQPVDRPPQEKHHER